MNQALQEEFRAKTISAQQAAALVKSGQQVYLGCCTSYDHRRRPGRPVGEARCHHRVLQHHSAHDGFWTAPIQTLSHLHVFCAVMRSSRPGKRGGADFTSVHLGQVDQWCRETFHPDLAFFDVSLPDEEGYMSFGASGCCMHPFIQEETDNSTAADRTAPLRHRPALQNPHLSGQACGVGRCGKGDHSRRPGRGPHRCPPCPSTCRTDSRRCLYPAGHWRRGHRCGLRAHVQE